MLAGILVFSHSLSVLFPLCLHFIDDITREAADFIPHIPVSIMQPSIHQGLSVHPAGWQCALTVLSAHSLSSWVTGVSSEDPKALCKCTEVFLRPMYAWLLWALGAVLCVCPQKPWHLRLQVLELSVINVSVSFSI